MLGAAVGVAAQTADSEPTAQGDLALTIYNDGQALVQDVRDGVRSLGKNRGYTAAVVFALLAVGFVALWVRSYWWADYVHGPSRISAFCLALCCLL